jgi:hypothetical protein
MVVEFRSDNSTSWIGNFERGWHGCDYCDHHPNGEHALIIANGQGYVVEPSQRRLISLIEGAIVDLFFHPTQQAVVLNQQELSFSAIDTKGLLWQSRRISWDGFRSIRIVGSILSGEAWNPVHEGWLPFELDLENGQVIGGSYPEELKSHS